MSEVLRVQFLICTNDGAHVGRIDEFVVDVGADRYSDGLYMKAKEGQRRNSQI